MANASAVCADGTQETQSARELKKRAREIFEVLCEEWLRAERHDRVPPLDGIKRWAKTIELLSDAHNLAAGKPINDNARV